MLSHLLLCLFVKFSVCSVILKCWEDLRRRWRRQVLKWVWKRPGCWKMENNFIWSLTGWMVDCWLVWCVRTSFIHSYMGNVEIADKLLFFLSLSIRFKQKVKLSQVASLVTILSFSLHDDAYFLWPNNIWVPNRERKTEQWNNIYQPKKASYSSLVTFLLSKFK